jgi:hypothetical protein
MSFDGKPSDDGFVKHYELHYQSKKVEADGSEKYQQFGCINFHGRQGSGAKLTPAIKKKWLARWTKAWFYCKVPRHLCEQGGKVVHILCSYMRSLEFRTEPPFDCADDNSGDIAFVQATKFIGGRDAMEEFIACDMYPLAIGSGFDRVVMHTTPVSKLMVPLLKFVAVHKDDNKDEVQFLARVELEAEGIVGSYTKPEHDACLAHMHNRGRLNHIFELAGVTYGPRPVPGTEEFTEAMRKRKLDATGRNPSKHLMAVVKKKMEAAKVAPSRGKASLKRPSAVEVASARPLKQSKKAMVHPAAAVTTTHVPARALSSKVATGASGSKGMTSVKKTAMPAHKHHAPAIGAMVVASMKEPQESSLHGQAAQDSMAEIALRLEPRGQSSWASLPVSAPRLELAASLQVIVPLDTRGV